MNRELKESKSHLRQMTARANQAEDSVVSLKVTVQSLERQITTLKEKNKSLESQNAKPGLFPSLLSGPPRPVPKVSS